MRPVVEQLERRCLLAAPQVLPPPPSVPRDGTPDGHFNMQFGPQRLIFDFSEDVSVAANALHVTNLTTVSR